MSSGHAQVCQQLTLAAAQGSSVVPSLSGYDGETFGMGSQQADLTRQQLLV